MAEPAGQDGDAAPRGLGEAAARGAAVTISGQGGRMLLQLAGIAILARLLDPTDYGLLAMVAVLVNLGEIFRDFGLSAAAIQAPELSRAARNNLFWANTALGVALFAVSVLVAPLVAGFFEQNSLTAITRVLALIFICNGMATQFRANLTRDLRFGRLAAAELLGQAVGLAVGIATAVSGWGYWALVAMQLAQAASVLLLLWALSGWTPGLPVRAEPMRSYWHFGGHLMAAQLLGFVSNNVDSLVIGRRFGPADLGLYDRAYRLLMVPLAQVRSPATTVALPVLSRLNDEYERYGMFLRRAQLVLGYTVIPALAVVAGAATPLVALALGPQWSESAPLLAILAVAGGLQTLSFVGYWVYLSRALTQRLLQYTAVSMAVKVVLIVLGSNWGVVGVAAAVALSAGVMWPVSVLWLSRLTPIPARQLLASSVRVLAVAAAGGAAAWLVSTNTTAWPPVLQLTGAALACGVIYGAAALIPAIRRDEVDVLSSRHLIRD